MGTRIVIASDQCIATHCATYKPMNELPGACGPPVHKVIPTLTHSSSTVLYTTLSHELRPLPNNPFANSSGQRAQQIRVVLADALLRIA